jgi:hypothetical protein
MQQVLVIRDERFSQHLEGIPHLESPKRYKAIHFVFNDPSLMGKWWNSTRGWPRRRATGPSSRVYIEKVAGTLGKRFIPLTWIPGERKIL